MQRRPVGEVHEAGLAHDLGRLRVAGLAAVQHHQRPRGGAQRGPVRPGPVRDPFGMLERRRGGQHDDLVATRRGEELLVERPAAVGPLAAADQGERPRAALGAVGVRHRRSLQARSRARLGSRHVTAHTGGVASVTVRRDDLYEVLGVTPAASSDEIAAAFRSHAKLLHPDRNPGDGDAAERFKELTLAYQTLIRPGSREAYDERHHRPTRPTTPPAGAAPASSTHDPIFQTPRRARAAVGSGIAVLRARHHRRGAPRPREHRRRSGDGHPVDRGGQAADLRPLPRRLRHLPAAPACYWAVT